MTPRNRAVKKCHTKPNQTQNQALLKSNEQFLLNQKDIKFSRLVAKTFWELCYFDEFGYEWIIKCSLNLQIRKNGLKAVCIG